MLTAIIILFICSMLLVLNTDWTIPHSSGKNCPPEQLYQDKIRAEQKEQQEKK